METEEFYSTLFHEMIHSTGHASRLNRIHPQKKRDERKDYAREELVAEIGPSFLINKSGIDSKKCSKTMSPIFSHGRSGSNKTLD